jgi:muconolactone delta-isomerase
MPPQQMLELIMAEYQAGKQLLKEGTMEEVYLLAGLKGGVLIGEAESGAALNAILSSLPLYTYLDIQIYPLLTLDEGIAQIKHGLEALKAQQ